MPATPARRHSRPLTASLLLAAGALPLPALADPSRSVQESQQMVAAAGDDLTELSLDDLLNMEVTSVSLRAEPLARAAAAVYVVSGEEIRRSGSRSIAEALRLVPGLYVGRRDAANYTISARGFSGDKLQVLVDGRSVYTPLTSTVFWDVLDTDLGAIERIEVIRGPGATLWGANAVNGVINVITRSALDTRGGELSAWAGSEERAGATLRAGTTAGTDGALRFYGKAYERDNAARPDGSDATDGQRMAQGGLRGDWSISERQHLTLTGDFYSGRLRSLGATSRSPVDNDLTGANLNAQWSLQRSPDSRYSMAVSADHYERIIPETFTEVRDTYDISLQHQLRLGASHDLVYGAGYRRSKDETGGPPLVVIFSPAVRSVDVWNVFVQDQIQLSENLVWTLGSKFERNDFSGDEVQPGTRLGWQFSPQWFTWAAVSRAVRTPNRLDHDIAIFCPPPNGFPDLCGPNETLPIGNRGFDAEKLVAYEGGLRYAHGADWSLDFAAFYNDYSDLRSTETVNGLLRFENRLEARGVGAELSGNWKISPTLDLRGSYSLLDLSVRPAPSTTDANSERTIEGSAPRHQGGLRVSYLPWSRWQVDSFLRYVSKLEQSVNPSSTSGPTHVPSYVELNLRLAYRPAPTLELAFVGENLLDSQHPEFGAFNTRSELERNVQLELIWSWQ